MGQYHLIVNADKREYLHPHQLGDGLKLREFGASGSGTMLALAALLAVSNNRSGGDIHSDSEIIGSWGGDRIAIVGDYAEDKDLPTTFDPEPSTIYARCLREGRASDPFDPSLPTYRDVSLDVRALLESTGEALSQRWDSDPTPNPDMLMDGATPGACCSHPRSEHHEMVPDGDPAHCMGCHVSDDPTEADWSMHDFEAAR